MNKIVRMEIDSSKYTYNSRNNVISFSAKLFDDVCLEITVPTTIPQEVTVYALRSDGESIKQTTDITMSENVIYVKLNNSFTCVKGKCSLELNLKDSEGQISTHTYYYFVEEKLGNENSFEVVTVKQLIDINEVAKETISDLGSQNTVASDFIPQLSTQNTLAREVLPSIETQNTKAERLVRDLQIENNYAEDNLPILVSENSKTLSNLPTLLVENKKVSDLLPTLIDRVAKGTQLLEDLRGILSQNSSITDLTTQIQELKDSLNILSVPNSTVQFEITVDEEGILTTKQIRG